MNGLVFDNVFGLVLSVDQFIVADVKEVVTSGRIDWRFTEMLVLYERMNDYDIRQGNLLTIYGQ